MSFQGVVQSRTQNPQTSSNTSRFAPRSFSIPEPQRPQTQEEIENEAFEQDKFEASRLQLKEKYGTIAPAEQGRLGILQAKMDSFWVQRMERATPQPNLLDIMIRNAQTTSATESAAPVQTKLTIGQPNDQYEQEADRVAKQVMSMAPPATPNIQRQAEEKQEEVQTKPLAQTITSIVQRQEVLEGDEPIQAKCESCEEEEQVQRSPNGVPQVQADLENRLNASKGGGSPLPNEVRSFMEPRFKADFSQVRVHTDGEAVQMNRELGAQAFTHRNHIYYGAGKVPAKDELTGHELTHVVQQTGHSTGHLQRWDMDNAPIGDPERDPQLRDLRPRTARQRYQEFIDNAERYGMPVRFLRYVERNYGIASGGSDAVTPAINLMSLEEETLQSVEHISPMPPFGEGTGVQTIYHESTHAYFDLLSGEPAVSDVIRHGEAHYEEAPLQGGGTGDDPERIFQEAAASYVGHRVSTWWLAFEELSMAVAGRFPDAILSTWIDRTRNNYNNRMAERTFGYQETGGFLGFGTSQTETTRQMSQQLKDFLDNHLLEGKIPDNFDEVVGFWQLIEQATITRMSEDTSQTDGQIQPKYDSMSTPEQSPGDLRSVIQCVEAKAQPNLLEILIRNTQSTQATEQGNESAAPVQPKLTIGQPNDQYEQEADRVAEQMMSMAPPVTFNMQHQAEEEQEEVQTKPLVKTITPIVQLQVDDDGGPYHPPEGTELRCGPDDDCSTLSLKINYLRHTIRRHREWDIAHPMPQYPDGRHAQEIAELENALSNCIDYTVRCRNQPQWIPATETQEEGEEEQASQQERSTIEKALIALGLSVALVGLVAMAILDPEPLTKLTLAGLSYATAIALLAILGVSHETSDHEA